MGSDEDEGRELGPLCEEVILLTGPVLFHPDDFWKQNTKVARETWIGATLAYWWSLRNILRPLSA